MKSICMNHEERYWKTLTKTANESFSCGHFEKALSAYKTALYRAEILNNHIPECTDLKIPFMQVYIISCNNLANTYIELDRFKEAENISKRVIYYLLHLATNKTLNTDEIQAELRRASVNYVQLVEKATDGKARKEQFFKTLKEQLIENNLHCKIN